MELALPTWGLLQVREVSGTEENIFKVLNTAQELHINLANIEKIELNEKFLLDLTTFNQV